ncbi:methylcrotonoyl-CoA carboxylase [Salvia divinorum]|uniref:Methylcrotonoyl-CoA carboxylase n=1 Tax=Salvia divinorum TaxID=28513 RepID=A0ABD1GSU6_SALDI
MSRHAFEARIYAENVPKGFLPATGILHHYHPAVQASSEVRVETGVEQGDTVSMHYDPMIAKLVVWGEDRTGALIKMRDSLSKFQVAGLPTNIAIAAACLCGKEHASASESSSGNLSVWYANPPFRVNHFAKRIMELIWEDESSKGGPKLVPVHVTYMPKGKYLIETRGSSIPDLELNTVHLGNHNLRVVHDGLSSMAVFQKDQFEHIHIWHGSSGLVCLSC